MVSRLNVSPFEEDLAFSVLMTNPIVISFNFDNFHLFSSSLIPSFFFGTPLEKRNFPLDPIFRNYQSPVSAYRLFFGSFALAMMLLVDVFDLRRFFSLISSHGFPLLLLIGDFIFFFPMMFLSACCKHNIRRFSYLGGLMSLTAFTLS